MNVTSLAVLAKYVQTGMPVIEKCITVDGSAIKEPKNVIVPIGTSIGDLIEFAGGFSCDPGKVIFGGPMTGLPAYSLSEPVIKNNNAVLAFSPADSHIKKASACIHCGRCVEACPHFLNPVNFNRAMNIENLAEKVERLEEESINLCMECGCCAFVCPAGRPLIENNRLAKTLVRNYRAHESTLK
jgi:electron transport complex protein RnfC